MAGACAEPGRSRRLLPGVENEEVAERESTLLRQSRCLNEVSRLGIPYQTYPNRSGSSFVLVKRISRFVKRRDSHPLKCPVPSRLNCVVRSRHFLLRPSE